MDLKTRKRIKNLPKYSLGLEEILSNIFKTGAANNKNTNTQNPLTNDENKAADAGLKFGNIAAIAYKGLDSTLKLANYFDKMSTPNIDEGELLSRYGQSTGYVGGIGYRRQNEINIGAEMQREEDAIRSEMLSSPMGLLTTPFFASDRKRAAQRRLQQIQNKITAGNIQQHDTAASQYINKLYGEKYGNPEDQLLYPTYSKGDEGIDPVLRQTYKNHMVYTSHGPAWGPQNGWGEKGEIMQAKDGSLSKIQTGPNDTARIYTEPGDTIYSMRVKNPFTGNPVAKDVPAYAAAGRLPELKAIQGAVKEQKNMNTKNKGNLRKFATGAEWYTNLIPAITGSAIGLKQYLDAYSQDVYHPNTYKTNLYERQALNDLDKLRIDAYPIMQKQREAEARVTDAITRSGGLSSGQKAISRIASLNNTQQNIANALIGVQSQNNQYRANAAQSRLTAGNQDAIRSQEAHQKDDDVYARGHAARQQGMQMGMYNFQNALEQYFANEFKRKQFDEQMSRYDQDLDIRRDELDALKKKWFGDNNNNNTTFTPKTKNAATYDYVTRALQDRFSKTGMLPQAVLPTIPFIASPDQYIPFNISNSIEEIKRRNKTIRRNNKRKK